MMIRGLLAISLTYLASTSLFRIYPQSVGKRGGGEKDLNDLEVETAMKIEKLMELDKVYQEPSYSRSDMARELQVSEAILSRIRPVAKVMGFPWNPVCDSLVKELEASSPWPNLMHPVFYTSGNSVI